MAYYDVKEVRRLQKGHGHDEDDDRDAARRLVTMLRKEIIAGADRPQSNHAERFRDVRAALVEVTDRLGIRFELQPDSLSGFVKKFPEVDMGSLLSNDILDKTFNDLLDKIDNLGDRHLLEPVELEATGWDLVDQEVEEIRTKVAVARTAHDWAAVARLCREVFTSLANAAYDEDKHGEFERDPKKHGGDEKARLQLVMATYISGDSNSALRGIMVKAFDAANVFQHSKSKGKTEVMICADATIMVVAAIRRLTAEQE